MQEHPYTLPESVTTALAEVAARAPGLLVRNVRAAMLAAIAGDPAEAPSEPALVAALTSELDAHVAVNALWEHVNREAAALRFGPRIEKLLASPNVQAAVADAAHVWHDTCVARAAEHPALQSVEVLDHRRYTFFAQIVATHELDMLTAAGLYALRAELRETHGVDVEQIQVTKKHVQHAVLRACQELSGL